MTDAAPRCSRPRHLAVLLLAGLLLWAGCGTDVCEEGYEKRKECAEAMNCDAVEPDLRDRCIAVKKQYTIPYDVYTHLPRSDGSAFECSGEEKEKWERIGACTLTPQNLCQCR